MDRNSYLLVVAGKQIQEKLRGFGGCVLVVVFTVRLEMSIEVLSFICYLVLCLYEIIGFCTAPNLLVGICCST